MSSCFKITLALLALLLTAATDAGAIRLSAVYYSACRRDVGVILHADQSRVKLLRLDGEIRSFYRFEIVYLAHYPVGSLSIEQVKNPEEVELVSVQTLHQREIADLALGWMMDHSEDEFSFLGLDGVETVVRADDIWDINFIRRAEALRFPSSGEKFRYVHPYPFQHCEYDDSGTGSGEAGSGEAGMVYPQQLVADPLLIKRELDHLQTGHERLRSFVSSKPFYPVPQIYRNDTELGMWLTAGSRHGASLTRSNSLTPVLVSGLSEGPFGFQRIWVAGAAPMGYSVHEEPQTQLYYRLKADHVHFSVMYDISAPLIGESKYNWHDYELGEVDDRWNELFHLAGGFDYGRMAMDISGNNLQYAVKHQGRFFTNRVAMPKFGLFYQDRDIRVEFYYGLAFDGKPPLHEIAEGNSNEDIEEAEALLAAMVDFSTELRLFRLNLDFRGPGDSRFNYSAIYRRVRFHQQPDYFLAGELRYYGRSLTNALYMVYDLNEDFTLTGYYSLEELVNRGGSYELGKPLRHLFGKAGLSFVMKL